MFTLEEGAENNFNKIWITSLVIWGRLTTGTKLLFCRTSLSGCIWKNSFLKTIHLTQEQDKNLNSNDQVVFNFGFVQSRSICSGGVLQNMCFFKNFTKFTEKHQGRSPFWIKMQASSLQHCYKRDSGSGFFLWICEIFKNIFLVAHFWAAATESIIAIVHKYN